MAKSTKPIEEPEIPVAAADAWSECYDSIRGMEELMCNSCDNIDGLSPNAIKFLHFAMLKTFEQAEIVDRFFRPERGE